MSVRTTLAILCWVAVCAGTVSAAAAPVHILGPGDFVPGFGRVGTNGFTAVAMDDAGRVLLVRAAVPQTAAYWADGERIVPAVDPAALGGAEFDGWSIGSSPNGNVALLAHEADAPVGLEATALVASIGGHVQRVASVGDRDAEGLTICHLSQPQVNDSGAVAFRALVALPGHSCSEPWDEMGAGPIHQAIYRARGSWQRLVGTGPLAPSLGEGWNLDLYRLAADGSAIVGQRFPLQQRVLTVGDGGIAVLEENVGVLAVDPVGEILFVADTAIYRTQRGERVRVVGEGDPAPWGKPYERYDIETDTAAFNQRGDVLFRERYQAVLHPADGGTPRVFPGITMGGELNGAGDAAVVELLTGSDVIEVSRWRGEERTRIAGTGDPLPNGDYLTTGGLFTRCQADDGTVAVSVDAANGEQGLVCIDTDGAHAVARVGDPAPAGRRFYEFGLCEFARPGEIVFAATRLVPDNESTSEEYTFYTLEPGVYRATADRLERVIGSGDVTADGVVVNGGIGLEHRPAYVGLAQSQQIMDASPSGDVLAMGSAYLVVRRAAGELERVPISTGWSGGGRSGIGFPEISPVDHRYLSGTSEVPTRVRAPRAAGAGLLYDGGTAAMSVDPRSTERRIRLISARLTDSGTVVILGSEPVLVNGYERGERAIVLLWHNGAMEQIFADDEVMFGREGSASDLQVAGERIAFQVPSYGSAARSRVFTYALGDSGPQEVLSPDTRLPFESLASISLVGIDRDGRVFLSGYAPTTKVLLVWERGEMRMLAEMEDAWPVSAGNAGVLINDSTTSVQVIGSAPGAASCPAPPTIVLPTATVTGTPTSTHTPRPSLTPRPLPPSPTGTVPPTPTAAPICGSGAVCIHVGSAAAAPGESARLEVWLETGGATVAGTHNQIQLPSAAMVRACQRNAAIDKSATAFRITSQSIDALVLAFDNSNAIPDNAVLYSCEIEVGAGAQPGRYTVGCTEAEATDPRGTQLPAACADGILDVKPASPAATPTPLGARESSATVPISATPTATLLAGSNAAQSGQAQAGSGGSCAVVPHAQVGYEWLPLLVGAVLVRARRAAKMRRG